MNPNESASTPDATTNARLLGTAAQLFWEKGFAATSTRQLSERLGIHKSSLYHHINSKDDLLYSISIRSLDNIQQAVLSAIAAAPVEGRLRAVIRAHLHTALSDRDMHATMLTELRSMPDGRRKEVLDRREGYEQILTEVVRDEQTAGRLRSELDARLATLALLNLLNWTIFWYREDGQQTIEQLADFFFDIYTAGTGAG